MTQLIFGNLVLTDLYKIIVKCRALYSTFLRAEHLHKLFIILRGRSVCSLFIQSFIYISMDSWIVLVHSGFSEKRPGTGYLTNNMNLFLTVMEAGKFKVTVLLGWVKALFESQSLHSLTLAGTALQPLIGHK